MSTSKNKNTFSDTIKVQLVNDTSLVSKSNNTVILVKPKEKECKTDYSPYILNLFTIVVLVIKIIYDWYQKSRAYKIDVIKDSLSHTTEDKIRLLKTISNYFYEVYYAEKIYDNNGSLIDDDYHTIIFKNFNSNNFISFRNELIEKQWLCSNETQKEIINLHEKLLKLKNLKSKHYSQLNESKSFEIYANKEIQELYSTIQENFRNTIITLRKELYFDTDYDIDFFKIYNKKQ